MSLSRCGVRRLKALGNAITPQQAYAVAACIMRAEGFRFRNVRTDKIA